MRAELQPFVHHTALRPMKSGRRGRQVMKGGQRRTLGFTGAVAG
jgi:hypothetical protein